MEKAGASSGSELVVGGADGGWVAFWESVSAAWQDPLLDELEAGVCSCFVFTQAVFSKGGWRAPSSRTLAGTRASADAC